MVSASFALIPALVSLAATGPTNIAPLSLPLWAQAAFYVATVLALLIGGYITVRVARSVAVRDAAREAAEYRKEAAQHQKDTVGALDVLNTRLTEEVDRLNGEIGTLRSESSQKDAKVLELQGKVTRLEEEVAALRQRLSAKEAELEAVKTSRDSLQAERDSLRQRLIHTEAELAHAQSDLARAKAAQDTPTQQGPQMQVVVMPQQQQAPAETPPAETPDPQDHKEPDV